MIRPPSKSLDRGRVLAMTAGATLLAACFLPDLDLEGRPCPCTSGFVCDTSRDVCVAETGSGGGTGSTTGSGGDSTTTSTTTSSGGGGAGGGPGVPATPLVISGDVGSGAAAFTVAEAFRLEFTSGTNWQLERWLDLPTSDLVNLSAQTQRDLLHEPIEMWIGGTWYGAEEADFGDVTLLDEAPARGIVETTLTYPPGGPFEVHSVYTVYASGRVGVRVTITNADSADQSFLSTEVNHTSVNEALAWGLSTVANGHGAMFQRTDGVSPHPTVLSISHDTTGSPGQDFPTNVYWDTGGMVTLTPGQKFERTGEFQVGLGEQTVATIADRADDVMQPSLSITSGATPVGTGYDAGAAAYALTATGSTITFALANGVPRHAPAFVIDGWSSSSWTLTRNGVVLASSAMPVGPGAIGRLDSGASRLVLVTVDTIPAGASDAERTFVLSSM